MQKPEKSYSLSELTTHISQILRVNFDNPLWIKAEISEFRENANGHCYLEFIEKDKKTDNLLAKIKATIWANNYRMLKPYFESSTGQSLRAGMNVLVAVTVDFHDVYGMSLNVRDIDPTFTLGELALRRKEIISQLEADGVIDMNKLLEMPLLPRRIAVISSATAAGFDDFSNQLRQNKEKYVFYPVLFAAVMQGDQAETSIISALEKIYEKIDLFDLVVIIRGGGATTDLACFDSYGLALNCAQFPLPIITGIGHQRDISITDMVAHTSVKTPTAAAEFIIDRMQEAAEMANDPYDAIYQLLKNRSQKEMQRMSDVRWRIKNALYKKVSTKTIALERIKSSLKSSLRLILNTQKNKLGMLEKNIEQHSPAFLLKFGYTITTLNGKRLTSATEVQEGDTIRTWLSDGNIVSKVDSSQQS
jgi:exodeoxyribonuclease VII large subunit